MRDGGQLATRIDCDDARTRPASVDPEMLDEPGLRTLIQLTAPEVGPIWTSQRDGHPVVRVTGAANSWADYDPTTHTTTQGGSTDLFELIERAIAQWERLGRPGVGRFGVTTGPDGSVAWLDSADNTIPDSSLPA